MWIKAGRHLVRVVSNIQILGQGMALCNAASKHTPNDGTACSADHAPMPPIGQNNPVSSVGLNKNVRTDELSSCTQFCSYSA